jgi:hypothetical protein
MHTLFHAFPNASQLREYGGISAFDILFSLKTQAVIDCVREKPTDEDWEKFAQLTAAHFPQNDEEDEAFRRVEEQRKILTAIHVAKKKAREAHLKALIENYDINETVSDLFRFLDSWESKCLPPPALSKLLHGSKGEREKIETLKVSVNKLKNSSTLADPLHSIATKTGSTTNTPAKQNTPIRVREVPAATSSAKKPVPASSSSSSRPSSKVATSSVDAGKKGVVNSSGKKGKTAVWTDDEDDDESVNSPVQKLPSHTKKRKADKVSHDDDDGEDNITKLAARVYEPGKRRKRNFWTDEQSDALKKAIETHGTSWSTIIAEVPSFTRWGRTQVDLKDRYRNMIKLKLI